ncbi:hypothetical protein RHGRI_031160 [Rhododendron griersonianum]|uniref:ATP-dependent Clp protease proteolytic subunit n=1 Tax=Rhododendron griersonianum TaxID=479676 RepID=A0AAV6I6U0_9ERIC|nr:hypothetical protein RHGRI_031160 [Rhododendron griersonianum]KAG5524413.1 hypothetical protein RHGRI_031160 [Rhododendron griersonianum]KAG5524414.1 hypothetical protein RHGRI_031160 [Rhododendron griersonianum]
MDALSLSSPPLSTNPLSSHLLSLNTRTPLSKPPTLSLRPSTSPQSFKCSPLDFHHLPKTLKTLAARNTLYMSAPSGPSAPSRSFGDGDVLGMLLRERIVFLGDEIDDLVAELVISQLLLLDAQDPTKDIKFFINSPGGSLSATMALYDVVRLVRADVSTVAMGLAANTASIILGGGTKGKRLAMPNARIMMHQPMGGAYGEAFKMEIQTKELMESKASVIKIISNFTGHSLEQVEKDIEYDRYMSPIEAVEYGIIDGIIDGDSIVPLMPARDERFSNKFSDIVDNPELDVPDDEIY